MSFLTPLGLLALLTLPILIALFFLKVRPRRKLTNAYFLWERVYQEKSSNALFKRFRDVWSLLLMALAFVLLSLGLAEPVFNAEDERDWVIILDSSASMQAVKNGHTLMERAKGEARDLLHSLNGTRQVVIGSIDSRLRFHSHRSSHPRELLEAVDAIVASDMPLGQDSLRQMGALVGGENNSNRIILITDGRNGIDEYPEGVEISIIQSEQLDNLGIVAADMQWVPGRPEVARLYLRILNASTEFREIDLEISNAETDAIVRIMSLNAQPGEEVESDFELEGVDAGYWRARLISDDAISLDDSVVFGLNSRDPLLVNVESENSWFFETCVRAFSRTGGLLSVVNEGADLTLSEGNSTSDTKMHLLFAPEGPSPFWKDLGQIAGPSLAEVLIPEHPILEHLDMSSLTFEGSRELDLPVGAVVLVASESGNPLIYVATVEEQKAVVLNFDPSESNFFLSPWFPVLVHSGAQYLAGREKVVEPLYTTGARVSLPGDEATIWSLEEIDGESKEKVTGAIELARAGSYRLQGLDKEFHIGAALLSSQDSTLVESQEVNIAHIASGWPISIWLIVSSILILFAESALYHRRKIG